jgi:HPt (histidine-containing phosphotransfer) domain-containing protein
LHAVLGQAAKSRARIAGQRAAAAPLEAPATPVPAPVPVQGKADALPAARSATPVPVPGLPAEVELSPALLDQDSLTALKNLQAEGDEGFVREIIELFLEDAVKRMDDLDAMMAAGSGADFTRAAHSIKGACSNFGATDLAKLCAQIETMGREGRMTETKGLLPGLRREFSRVRLALEAEMARL